MNGPGKCNLLDATSNDLARFRFHLLGIIKPWDMRLIRQHHCANRQRTRQRTSSNLIKADYQTPMGDIALEGIHSIQARSFLSLGGKTFSSRLDRRTHALARIRDQRPLKNGELGSIGSLQLRFDLGNRWTHGFLSCMAKINDGRLRL